MLSDLNTKKKVYIISFFLYSLFQTRITCKDFITNHTLNSYVSEQHEIICSDITYPVKLNKFGSV